jgi:hypothetical protein
MAAMCNRCYFRRRRRVTRIPRRASSSKNRAAGIARSGGRTPRAVIAPEASICAANRRRRARVDIHADVPCRHARHVAVLNLDDRPSATHTLDDDPQDLVLVAGPSRHGFAGSRRESEQHVARDNARAVDARQASWT